MNIHDLAHEMAAAIKQSDEYRSFMTAKEEASKNPDLTEMLNDFQEKQYELQRKQMVGESLGPDVMAQVQNLYGILMRDPLAAAYIQAEVRFSLMVNDVYQIIGEAVKSE
jgi:cell fate (sporulation/competence/biofilm development) regulator YlbF (YheA/YmcA/DUF963 family)